ncbi:MAG: hypothetical protein ACKOFT_09950 [Actinomycetota bacterium]
MSGVTMKVTLDRQMILRLLDDLAAELGDSPEAHTVVIAGGAMLALLGLRNSTVDVDSVVPLPQEVRLAAKQVALAHGLGGRIDRIRRASASE